MTGLTGGFIVTALPVVVLIVALTFGPLPIVVRGLLRGVFDPHLTRSWYRAVSLGLGLGMVGSVVAVMTIDTSLTSTAALLCLLFLLAGIDWQWRWLPIEWTIGVIVLGLIFAFQSTDPLRILIHMALPAGVLLSVRQTVLWAMKKEALGLGDVWLVAGLGAFLAPFESFLLIGFAALSGLVEIAIRVRIHGSAAVQRGVSYGTHLCIIFVIVRNFASLG